MKIWVTCLDEDNDPLPDGFCAEAPAQPGLIFEVQVTLLERVLASLGYTVTFSDGEESPKAWAEVNYIDVDEERSGA